MAYVFGVGDRVRCIRACDDLNAAVGELGTICVVDINDHVGVEFDIDVGGHELDGECENGHGWWFGTAPFENGYLEIVIEEDAIEIDESDFGVFLETIGGVV